jgi:hypothetical protein
MEFQEQMKPKNGATRERETPGATLAGMRPMSPRRGLLPVKLPIQELLWSTHGVQALSLEDFLPSLESPLPAESEHFLPPSSRQEFHL